MIHDDYTREWDEQTKKKLLDECYILADKFGFKVVIIDDDVQLRRGKDVYHTYPSLEMAVRKLRRMTLFNEESTY